MSTLYVGRITGTPLATVASNISREATILIGNISGEAMPICNAFARAPRRLTIAASRRPEQLRARFDAMQDDRAPTDPVDEEKVEPQGVEDVLKRFGVEFGVLSVPVIAPETLEDD
jgi:hypothetical protein